MSPDTMTLEEKILTESVRSVREDLTRSIVRSRLPPSKAVRSMSMRGVLDVTWDRKFDAAVQTDDGPAILSGVVLQDRQSDRLALSWLANAAVLDATIKQAYSRLAIDDALEVIDGIWESAERIAELAAARTRLLLGKKPSLPRGDVPEWFSSQIDAMRQQTDHDEITPRPDAIECSTLLVQSLVAAGYKVEARCEVGPLGRIVFDWHMPDTRLRWMVEGIDMPWPSIRVYEVFSDATGNMRNRVIHDAFRAIESMLEALHFVNE